MKNIDGFIKDTVKPFRLWGNIYFVGTVAASTHIIDTGEGLIMIDSGYQESLHLVIHNMHTLGLDPMNIKYIIHTHGHIDHMGATRALVMMTGAKTFIGAPDKEYVTGEVNLSWADELGLDLIPFEPDVLIYDNDEITLGNTTVRAVATPGHTPGAMSFFINATDGERDLIAAMFGGIGFNSMSRDFLLKYGLSFNCRENFVNAMERLSHEKADIYLGNHVGNNGTVEKGELVLAGDSDAFIDPELFPRAARELKASMLDLIEREKDM